MRPPETGSLMLKETCDTPLGPGAAVKPIRLSTCQSTEGAAQGAAAGEARGEASEKGRRGGRAARRYIFSWD